jgi:hypothetical protein
LGFWPYWGGYPYYYGYGPGWGPYAYYSPYYYPAYPDDPDNSYDRDRRDRSDPRDERPDYRYDREFRSKPPASAPRPNAQPSNGTGSNHFSTDDDPGMIWAIYRPGTSKGTVQRTHPRPKY